MSLTSKLPLLERLGKTCMDGIIASIRANVEGKVTLDNIDGRTIADQMRLSSRNRDYHYTAGTYYPDRCVYVKWQKNYYIFSENCVIFIVVCKLCLSTGNYFYFLTELTFLTYQTLVRLVTQRI